MAQSSQTFPIASVVECTCCRSLSGLIKVEKKHGMWEHDVIDGLDQIILCRGLW